MSLAVWMVHALEAPRVPRRCPRCDAPRRFVSSGKFRLNAQKRRVDVWLIYNCPDCDDRWNAPIACRALPEEIAGYARYQENDPATAWSCAFAVGGADLAVPWRVERDAGDPPLTVELRLADRVHVRLDRLLAAELGLSRAEVARRASGDLRRAVWNGQVVKIS
jgi:hypothetical protein